MHITIKKVENGYIVHNDSKYVEFQETQVFSGSYANQNALDCVQSLIADLKTDGEEFKAIQELHK